MRDPLAIGCGFLAVLALGGCGGDEIVRTCDEPRLYQQAEVGERVKVPEDLDEPEAVREMPVPEASPRPARPPGSPCLDLPPSVLTGE